MVGQRRATVWGRPRCCPAHFTMSQQKPIQNVRSPGCFAHAPKSPTLTPSRVLSPGHFSYSCPPFPFAACVVLLLPRDATFDLATHHLGLLQAIMSWLAAKISEGTDTASDMGYARTITSPMPRKLPASNTGPAQAPLSPLLLGHSSESLTENTPHIPAMVAPMPAHDAQEAAASLDLQLQPQEGLRQRTARKTCSTDSSSSKLA